MEDSARKVVSFKDLTDKKHVTIKGTGKFYLGLSTAGELNVQTNEHNLCVALLQLTVQENGSCLLALVNKDLVCSVNSREDLCGEINLKNGMQLEIAEKKLVFIDGPITKQRRKLPLTPGMLVDAPPIKPARLQNIQVSKEADQPDSKNIVNDMVNETKISQADDKVNEQWLESSFCMLDMPEKKQNMFQGLETDEQISILSASHFTKQLRLFTDAHISSSLLDDIFKLFMDSTDNGQQIYLDYLTDIAQASQQIPNNAYTRPMHGPAVKMLTAMLKQSFDPVSRVVLILDLLRTFSHFDANLETMVQCQTTSAVLGSMMAFPDVIAVQQYGMDILAKISKHRPTFKQKATLQDVGIDVVIRAIKRHGRHLSLARAICRVLANISCTLFTALDNWLNTESCDSPNVVTTVETHERLLVYVFQEGIPETQSILQHFRADLGINTEGRRFIYYYTKLPELQSKKSQWLTMLQYNNNTETLEENTNVVTEGKSHEVSSRPLLKGERTDEEPQSILKKKGSFKELRKNVKKLAFADDTEGGSESELSESENDFQNSLEGDLKLQVHQEQEFSANVVKHLVRNLTKQKRCQKEADNTDFSVDEDDEKFMRSLNLTTDCSDLSIHKQIYTEYDNLACDGVETGDQNSTFDASNHFNYKENMSFSNECFEMISAEQISKSMHAQNEKKKIFNNAKPLAANVCQDNSNLSEPSLHDAVSIAGNEKGKEEHSGSIIVDVPFMGILVRTQIIAHVGSLVFKGDDCKVLMVIDQPIRSLLKDSWAPACLLDFANNQYASNITLMDMEPSIVINVIDAVRYRSVTKELVVSAVLNLTKSITANLHEQTVHTTMLFYKALFSDNGLKAIFDGDDFCNEFRVCFQKAIERLQNSQNIEEIKQKFAMTTNN